MNEAIQVVREGARTGTLFGIVTLILGILCIAAPAISGMSVTVLVAILLITAGIARLFPPFKGNPVARSRRRKVCLRRLLGDRARHARRSYRERKRASVYLRLTGEVIP